MNTYTAKIEWGNTKTYTPNFTSIKICMRRFSGWTLMGIKMVLEYGLGMHIGAAIGYIIGIAIGNCYMDHFMYVNLHSLDGIQQWLGLPCVFATHGAIIGIAVSVIITAIINRKLLYKNIIDLHKNGITDIGEISHFIICPKWIVQKTIDQLPQN